ncbi:M28 family peptidase [Sphingosinicella sp. CPCC 101087]|uniref:M28 family peptidase n=1 Tax=Sphingosinicella sp. CPCC 101087 TaxID=2497754 RepID=UPI00101C0EB0|nr:M28 family metallopeptidase [Sphingosinicella sp. CPCC 101087]
MKNVLIAVAAVGLLIPAVSAQRPQAPQAAPAPSLRALADDVSEESLRTMVEGLVSFGTRHTLSSRNDPERGIGAALAWTEAEFGRFSRECGDCLEVIRTGDTVTGQRIPEPTLVENVVAIQRGTREPGRVVIITGHIDSRVTDVMNATAEAPGANDDGSGTAAVIEAARVLSKHRFPATIVYAALSGEEQGLVGARILADHARAQGWQVVANLNNDIIGNSCGSDGTCDAGHVRVFSEGLRWQGGDALRPLVRGQGGENDSPSRNLSRFLDRLAGDLSLGLDVRQIWRNDRFGRGGDHSEFLNAGFPAVRLSVAVENYNWQHQDLRTEGGVEYGDTIDKMDFPYLRRVTALNVAALAALARAPMPPVPTVEGAVSPDTTLAWEAVPNAAAYIVRWRRTDAANWHESVRVPGSQTSHVLRGIRVDDWVFGVSSVSADGYESPVASAVPGGAFRPYTPPAQQ